VVDGVALVHLTHADIAQMLTGKMGAARKLSVLIEQMKVSSSRILVFVLQ